MLTRFLTKLGLGIMGVSLAIYGLQLLLVEHASLIKPWPLLVLVVYLGVGLIIYALTPERWW